MKTPEQRVIEIIGHRLGITPFFAEEIAKEILEAHTEPEDDIPAGYKCAKCKKRLSECTCTDADWLKVKHEFGKDFTCNLNSGGSAHTEPEDEPSRYQTALEVQAEYMAAVNKYSKQKSWEEGQSQSGLFMWLGMKLQQEDKC